MARGRLSIAFIAAIGLAAPSAESAARKYVGCGPQFSRSYRPLLSEDWKPPPVPDQFLTLIRPLVGPDPPGATFEVLDWAKHENPNHTSTVVIHSDYRPQKDTTPGALEDLWWIIFQDGATASLKTYVMAFGFAFVKEPASGVSSLLFCGASPDGPAVREWGWDGSNWAATR
jgi:hypothetical protein